MWPRYPIAAGSRDRLSASRGEASHGCTGTSTAASCGRWCRRRLRSTSTTGPAGSPSWRSSWTASGRLCVLGGSRSRASARRTREPTCWDLLGVTELARRRISAGRVRREGVARRAHCVGKFETTEHGNRIDYRGERPWSGPAARYDMSVDRGSGAKSSEVDAWLTDRWRAFTTHADRILETPVRHEPSQLRDATFVHLEESLTAAAGIRVGSPFESTPRTASAQSSSEHHACGDPPPTGAFGAARRHLGDRVRDGYVRTKACPPPLPAMSPPLDRHGDRARPSTLRSRMPRGRG